MILQAVRILLTFWEIFVHASSRCVLCIILNRAGNYPQFSPAGRKSRHVFWPKDPFFILARPYTGLTCTRCTGTVGPVEPSLWNTLIWTFWYGKNICYSAITFAEEMRERPWMVEESKNSLNTLIFSSRKPEYKIYACNTPHELDPSTVSTVLQ